MTRDMIQKGYKVGEIVFYIIKPKYSLWEISMFSEKCCKFRTFLWIAQRFDLSCLFICTGMWSGYKNVVHVDFDSDVCGVICSNVLI